MLHDAKAVANYLIAKSIEEKKPLTPLQIMKLVYFCHGWQLGLYREPLIRQAVEAWRYGPVVADVYHSLKDYGASPVTAKLRVPPVAFEENEKTLVDEVYKKYGGLNGIELMQLTHAPGTPWADVWNRTHEENAIISDALIEKHYAEKAEQSVQNAQ